VFKTRCRALLATMASTVIGLMSNLRDFEGFTAESELDSSSSWPQVQVVGSCGVPVGSPGVRDRAAAALTAAVVHLKGGDRELLEQVCVCGGGGG
jgi:hypothetical protein